MATSRTPPYHRLSVLKPRNQRAAVAAFGRDRPFQQLTGLRGTYRSRPLWVFYQTFTTFLMAFASQFLSLFGAGFRRA